MLKTHIVKATMLKDSKQVRVEYRIAAVDKKDARQAIEERYPGLIEIEVVTDDKKPVKMRTLNARFESRLKNMREEYFEEKRKLENKMDKIKQRVHAIEQDFLIRKKEQEQRLEKLTKSISEHEKVLENHTKEAQRIKRIEKIRDYLIDLIGKDDIDGALYRRAIYLHDNKILKIGD